MHRQAHGNGVGTNDDAGFNDLRAARRAVRRLGQAFLELFQQAWIRYVGERRSTNRQQRHGRCQQECRCDLLPADAQAAGQSPRPRENLGRQPGGKQQQQENLDDAQRTDQPARHHDQPHGLGAVDRPAPAERVRIPLPRGDAGSGLHDRVRRITRERAGRRCGRDSLLERGRLRHRRAPHFLQHLLAFGEASLCRVREVVQLVLVELRLQLRVKGDAQLARNEWHQCQHQYGCAQQLVAADQLSQASGRRDPHQRDCDDQVQPHPAERIRFVEAQRQSQECDDCRRSPQQPPDADRCNQDQEKVQQLPAAHPAAARDVRPGRCQQLAAGRQVQRRPDAVEGAVPAGYRHLAARLAATERFQLHVVLANFDAGLAGVRPRGNQEAVLRLARAQQAIWGRHIEPPAAAHLAADLVAHDETAAVEIQPQGPLEGQRIARGDDAAAALGDRQGRAGRRPEGRESAPALRHLYLQRVHRRQTLGDRDAQAVVGLVAPDLGGGHVRALPGPCQRVDDVGSTRGQVHGPAARPYLQAQLAVGLQAGRQRALQAQGHVVGRQQRPEDLLSHAAGDVDLQAGNQPGRHVIGDQAMHDGKHGIDNRCLALSFAEVQPVTVEFGALDRAPVDRQCDQTALCR